MSALFLRANRARLAATALFLLGSVAPAAAQTAADPVTAEALFSEGRRLVVQGRWADACPKFAESQRLDPAIGTLLNLGDCYERLGRTASAWARFREAAETAHRAGDAQRESVAADRAASLAGSLRTLAIAVPATSDAPGLEIKRDGIVMGRAVWGSVAPVDPGAHVVEASAPGRKTWSSAVTIDADHPAVAIEIPRLAEVEQVAPTVSAEQHPRGRTQRAVGAVTVGVGLASLGAGSLFGILAASRKGDSSEHCKGNICDARGVELRDQAITYATVSTVTFIVGLAGVAGGTVVWLAAPGSDKRPDPRGSQAAFAIVPVVGSGMFGVGVGGVIR